MLQGQMGLELRLQAVLKVEEGQREVLVGQAGSHNESGLTTRSIRALAWHQKTGDILLNFHMQIFTCSQKMLSQNLS